MKMKYNACKVTFGFIFIILCYQILLAPYIGIANNGDFERMMVSTGFAYEKDPWLAENYDYCFWGHITNEFILTQPKANGWYSIYQINIFLSRLLCRLVSKTGFYDIRYLGFVNMSVYLLGIGLVLYWINQKQQGMMKIILMILTAILAVDGYVIQYMNAFYCEIGTINAEMLFYGILACLFCFSYNRWKRFCLFLAACAAAVAVITIKQQDILCILPMVALLLCYVHKKNGGGFCLTKKRIVISLCLTGIIGISSLAVFASNTGAGHVGGCNVMLMDILSRSNHPQEHLNDMGFTNEQQSEIMQAIGENALTERGNVIYAKYGTYFTRMHELKVLADEPEILLSMIRDRSTGLFQDAANLGNFLEETGTKRCAKSQAFRLWSGIRSHVYRPNAGFYFSVLIIAGVCTVYGIWKKKRMYYFMAAMCVSNILRFVTVLLGDSSHDDIKHFFALNVEFDVIFLLLVIHIATGFYSMFGKRRKTESSRIASRGES